MTTANIISTPNIEGNIGSCTTSSIEVRADRTFFVQNIETITTNSCNGDTQHFQSWEFTDSIAFVVLVFVVCFISWCVAWASRESF